MFMKNLNSKCIKYSQSTKLKPFNLFFTTFEKILCGLFGYWFSFFKIKLESVFYLAVNWTSLIYNSTQYFD